jgi:hypothetical protein
MKAAGWIALVLVVAGSLGAWAQCDCGTGVDPNCFLKFRSNETIEFTLIAPVDYFGHYQTTVSPQIFGWRVEDSNGNVIRTVIYPGEPRSRLTVMEWDLYGDDGYLVEPGFYQVIVMTTASDVSYQVFIEEACRSFCACACNCYAPTVCDSPCRPPYGELYLSLDVGEARPCNGLTFSITITFECEEEAP